MQSFENIKAKAMQVVSFLKEKWDQREQPINIWKENDKTYTCMNCGKEFQGSYCPRCGQSANTERFTMKNVLTNTLEVWGFGNRGFVRTLIELLYRPGYMIQDYLHGHRQAYFQPVKMLFILCVIYTIVLQFFSTEIHEGMVEEWRHYVVAESTAPKDYDHYEYIIIEPDDSEAVIEFNKAVASVSNFWTDTAQEYIKWRDRNKALALLLMHALFAVGAMRIFKHSPKNNHMTLPESFFVQVFIACQFMIISTIYMLFVREYDHNDRYPLPIAAQAILMIYIFRQIYGYGIIKTAWKTFLMYLAYTIVVAIPFFLITSGLWYLKH
ncbi:MAG: DUF3667 domain-containing protein [Prevotella sp.]|nr:DUF3667 domain-containing protein [Prevotella sp.]